MWLKEERENKIPSSFRFSIFLRVKQFFWKILIQMKKLISLGGFWYILLFEIWFLSDFSFYSYFIFLRDPALVWLLHIFR